jgi:RHS repeat-associated protein
MVRAESITATVRYTYTVDGLRIAQNVDGNVTAFVWDWATGIPEMLSDGDNRYLVGHDTLGWEDAGGWTYAVPDALGSVRQAVDATAAVVVAREWSPYGVESGGARAGLGYTGEWFDASVGLQYLRARWYDSDVGRFTQMDPLQLEENLYAYAQLNPVLLTDPSGYLSQAELTEAFGFSSWNEVKRWFRNLNTRSGRLIKDDFGRWGFLALLLDAEMGDKITGLTLKTFGRRGEIALGTIGRVGCDYAILTPDMRVVSLPDYIEEYLAEINAKDNNVLLSEVPPWRTVVHRYRLNQGNEYRDSYYTDLPSWYAVGIEVEVFAPAIVTGLGGGLELIGISDRYGNDYVSFALNVGGGLDLLPLGASYSEGYPSSRSREWGTNTPIMLNERQLIDAMTGWDIGLGFTILGHNASGSVGVGWPIYTAEEWALELVEFFGIGASVSLTRPVDDNPMTKGWHDLDQIPLRRIP